MASDLCGADTLIVHIATWDVHLANQGSVGYFPHTAGKLSRPSVAAAATLLILALLAQQVGVLHTGRVC